MKNKLSHKQLAAEIVGWYGALAILVAYMLVSFDVIEGDGLAYQFLNLTGAIGVLIIALYKKVKQSVLLNVFWALIAVVAIVNIIL
jgi:hypothetical protein